MRKVVINNCYGGFSLSDAAIRRYAEIKGVTLYIEPRTDGFASLGPEYWTKPPDERGSILTDAEWHDANKEDRVASNRAHKAATLDDRSIARDDPALVQTVEELSDAANGEHAKLAVVEIPSDAEWQIEEYDGNEWVAEKHRVWS